jgi:hypothetical protein
VTTLSGLARLRVRAAVAVTTYAALACPSAVAAVELEASAAPTVVRYGDTKSILYSVSMVNTGQTEETFTLEMIVPRFGDPGGPPEQGALVSPIAGTLRLVGPGRYISPLTGTLALPACLAHGVEPFDRQVSLALPPNSTTTLSARYRVASTAPWPDSGYRLTFVARPRLIGGSRGTLERRQVERSPALALTGPTGVRIDFTAWRRSSGKRRSPATSLRVGHRLMVRGRTDPFVPARALRLVVERRDESGDARRVSVTRVARTGRGRFAALWRPRRPGSYALSVTYRRHRMGLLADRTCQQDVRVRASGVE